MQAAIATRSIEAPEGTPLGGYWGRTSGCLPCRDGDGISARVLVMREDETLIIVSLDLIGISPSFAERIKRALRQFLPEASIMVAATHTHTSAQTHDTMVGFGHTSAAYMDSIIEAVASATREAMLSLRPGGVRHVSTVPLDLSVNRRERLEEQDPTEPNSKRSRGQGVMWFEKAGRTTLGQRPEGPRPPVANVIEVVSLGDPSGGTIATVLCWACHPVCCGKAALAQSADFVHRARQVVEAHTGAPALYLNGACGDVNPLERGGGYEAADRLGEALGKACVAALRRGASVAPTCTASVACAKEGVARLPLAALPAEADAARFVAEQRAWHESACAADGDPWPAALPEATLAYAEQVLAASRAGQSSTHIDCALQAVRLGPVVLLGVAAEVFSDFAAHFAAASPHATTITIGYANGCIGYLPTEAENPWGGYEVVHAHVPYGQWQRLHAEAERPLISTALELLEQLPASPLTGAGGARTGGGPPSLLTPRSRLLGEALESRCEHAHDTYNSIGVTADGTVLYVLSSAHPLVGGALYRYADGDDAPTKIINLTDACGDPPNCVAQGKAHCPLLQDTSDGAVYLGTHVGWYIEIDGMETLPAAGAPGLPPGVGPYPGGCLLRLEADGTTVRCLARLPDGEGVITFAADFARRRLYCLAWPSGRVAVCAEQPGGAWHLEGLFDYPGRGHGEGAHPRTGEYRPVCRALVVDPRSGRVYLSNSQGDVLEFDGHGVVRVLLSGAEGLVRDYFGTFAAGAAGSMAFHWRQVQWCPERQAVLGMHGNSGYLFELTLPPPAQGAEEDDEAAEAAPRPALLLIARLTSAPSQRCGMADQFSYGYLGFEVRRGIVFYLTGAPVFDAHGKRIAGKASTAKGEAKGIEHLHLVTYDLGGTGEGQLRDHGPIFFSNRVGFPTYVNSLAVGDAHLYALGRLPNGRTDVFRVRVP